MENQKIINLLDNTPNQPTKSRSKNWVKINDDARGMYNTNNQIKFKTSMLKSSLGNYSDVYILVSWTITITGEGDNDAAKRADERNEGVIIEICLPFTDCISEINNTQIANAKYINVVIPMYNLNEYSNDYSKTSGYLWEN